MNCLLGRKLLSRGAAILLFLASFTVTGMSQDLTTPTFAATCTAPSVPSSVTAIASTAGSPQITVQWRPASGNGTAIQRYWVAILPAADSLSIPPNYFLPNIQGFSGILDTQLSATMPMKMVLTTPRVALGVSYRVKVSAYNGCGLSDHGFGWSAWSSSTPAVTPVQPSQAPTHVTATAGNQSATVAWFAQSNSGYSPVSDYLVTATPGGMQCHSGVSLVCTFSNLNNGVAYKFTVRAITLAGQGIASGFSNVVTPAGRPGVPTNIRALAQSRALLVSWSAPISNGGASIIGYEVDLVGTSFKCQTTTASQCQILNLSNGVQYTVAVFASNAVSRSDASQLISATPSSTPDAPSSVTATGATRSAIVTWRTPPNDGGASISSYVVTAAPGGSTCTSESSLYCTVPNLNPGTSYLFSVVAKNVQGSSVPAGTSSPITIGLPSQPSSIVATSAEKSLSISWASSQANGFAVTAYIATLTPGGKQCAWLSSSGDVSNLTCAISDLVNGQTYSVSVVAQNAIGNSVPGVVDGTPQGSPGAPTGVVADSGNGQSTVRWTAPIYQGSPPSGLTYYVTSTPGSFTCSTATLTCVVRGLTNGTSYTFVVYAKNGTPNAGVPSNPSSSILIGLPAAPSNVVAEPSLGGARISWLAPANGGPLGAYTATSRPGGYSCQATGVTYCTISGLTNLVTYSFTVVMINDFGRSVSSDPSSGITPGASPLAPTSVTARVGSGQLTVSWVAAALNVGSAISGYTVTATPGGKSCTTAQLSCIITGLTNFTSYTLTVVATNTMTMQSPPSTSVTGMPVLPPILTVSTASVAYRGVTVNVNTSATSPDAITSVACTWGDGNSFTVAAGSRQAGHTYGADGSWTIACTATDTYGITTSANLSVAVQAQHQVTVYDNPFVQPALAIRQYGTTFTENFQIASGVSQLTSVWIANDTFPAGRYLGGSITLELFVNSALRYSGNIEQHHDGQQRYNFAFGVGVSAGDWVTIKVTFNNVQGQPDLFQSNSCSSSYISNANGTFLYGQLLGLS